MDFYLFLVGLSSTCNFFSPSSLVIIVLSGTALKKYNKASSWEQCISSKQMLKLTFFNNSFKVKFGKAFLVLML